MHAVDIKTHGSVLAAKKREKKKKRAHQCVIYATGQVADFNSKTMVRISTNSTYFIAFIYSTLHAKFKRSSPSCS